MCISGVTSERRVQRKSIFNATQTEGCGVVLHDIFSRGMFVSLTVLDRSHLKPIRTGKYRQLVASCACPFARSLVIMSMLCTRYLAVLGEFKEYAAR